MTLLKRFDALEVAADDLDGTIRTYQQNFGFELKPGRSGDGAALAVGDAEIRLVAGVAARIAPGGEGLAALWLEAEDVEKLAAALRSRGIDCPALRIDENRRVLALDAKIANQVPLFIFDRKV